jgi:N-acyl-D-aspartate/D-glutamate deacylase
MLDLIIRGGTIVDGTGTPGVVGDVGVKDGRIVAVGTVTEEAVETVDATGQIVCPGFIDLHTHYDAQAFWDPTLSPSPLHGVTTVFAGNCGFTIAPLAPEDGDYLMRMLARVEGMPLEALQVGLPWDWRTFADYLAKLDGTLMPNAGFLVGHSALRRHVMHDDANQRKATSDEIAEMQQLLREALEAGGMGFSSTWSTSHNDHLGHPVPSRCASRDELIALCEIVGEFPGTQLEFIPQVGEFTQETFELMADMSAAANRPLNWNLLQVYAQTWDLVQHQLTGGDIAEARGGKVRALTLPDSFRLRLNFRAGFILDILPGWEALMALPPEEKLRQLRDPETRAEWNRMAQSPDDMTKRAIANWAGYYILETHSAEYAEHQGRLIGDIAKDLGKSPWDTLADIVVADELNTIIANQDRGQDDATWARRVEVWRDGRAIVGASDAGAHLDMIDSFAFSTTVLGEAVRKRGLLPVEEAVQLLTDEPARLYGVKERGRITEGYHADLVVFDPTEIGAGPVTTKFDLPAGAMRVTGGGLGISHVYINGVEAVRDGEFTDARPGTLLRSGRDTSTVTAR